MPKFLTRHEVYRLLQRELPANAYADGEESAFYTTADMASIADCAASAYGNLERIYDNYWPQTAVERIADWEITAFGVAQDASQTIEQRQDRATAKIRSRKGLTIQDMIDTVQSVIGTDKNVQIAEWGCGTGGWMLNVSLLGISTILNGINQLLAVGANLCELTPADFGLTDEQWIELQTEAYTYEVLIYDYTLTTAERAEIDAQLSIAEPARSTHVITDGLDPDDALELG